MLGAEAYARTYSSRCRVCNISFAPSKLSKRPRVSEEESQLEQRALKRLKEREAAEHSANLSWARKVAPCAAYIMSRHFSEAQADDFSHETDLSFETIVLSIVHCEEVYINDLSERLSRDSPSDEVERHITRLQNISYDLSSSAELDQACREEFMRVFTKSMAAISEMENEGSAA